MESEGDGDGAEDRQRQERKEGRSYHDNYRHNPSFGSIILEDLYTSSGRIIILPIGGYLHVLTFLSAAAGPSHLVFSNLSQSHCDQEFQSQKTQDTSSGITVRRDHAASHPAAGSSCPDPVYAARSLYKQAPEPNTEE